MRRIVVRPDGLQKLGGDLGGTANELRGLADRLGATIHALDWETRHRVVAEDRVNEVLQRAALLSSKAEELGRFLARKAGDFRQADGAGVGALDAAGGAMALQASPLSLGAAWSDAFRTALRAFAPIAVATNPALLPIGTTMGLGWLVKQWPNLFGRPDHVGVGGGGAIGTVPPAAPTQPATPPAPAPAPAPIVPPTPEGVDQQIANVFPKAEDQLILKHTIGEEGPGKFGASWGGVVYHSDTGLRSDRQWINFGLISFAYPSGSGGGVLRSILNQPGEEEALREILVRHLNDNPGGEVGSGWSHLLNDRGDTGIAPKSKEQMADEFIAAIKSGKDKSHQDWMFKYVTTPVKTESGVANGRMRDDWDSALTEFLARPASQEAQLTVMKNQYFAPAATTAQSEFGLTSVRGVAFIYDTTVQHGGPTDAMRNIAATTAYQNAPESEKLQMLLGCFKSGTTTYNRRLSVLKSDVLTDAPYNP